MKRVWPIKAAFINGMVQDFLMNSPLLTILGRHHWVVFLQVMVDVTPK